jgi:hypothetical protein
VDVRGKNERLVADMGRLDILIWVWYLRLTWKVNEHKPTDIRPQ